MVDFYSLINYHILDDFFYWVLVSFFIHEIKRFFNGYRFVSSDILKKNSEAKRFVCAEFGTPVSPDPSKGRFAK